MGLFETVVLGPLPRRLMTYGKGNGAQTPTESERAGRYSIIGTIIESLTHIST